MNADSYGRNKCNLLTHNQFAYCINNPVNRVDTIGKFAVATIILVVSIVSGVVMAAYTAHVTKKNSGKDDIGKAVYNGILTGLTVYTCWDVCIIGI